MAKPLLQDIFEESSDSDSNNVAVYDFQCNIDSDALNYSINLKILV